MSRSAQPTTLHAAVIAQAQRSPDATAIVSGSIALTYASFVRHSTAVGERLRDLGAAPDALVGVCVPRSHLTVVAILGALCSGAGYLPLDASEPTPWLRSTLDRSGATCLVTSSGCEAGAALATSGIPVVMVDHVAPLPELEAAAEGDPDHLAYVMYTSGSTGVPKGVAAAHRNAVAYLGYLRSEFALGPSDIVLQLPSIAFDASVRDIFGPLASGGTVVMIDDATRRNPVAMVSALRQHRVTQVLSAVPSMLDGIADAAVDVALPELRRVVVSGEPMRTESARRASTVLDCDIVSQYGATECTMTSMVCRLDDAVVEAVMPLGEPIPGTRVQLRGPAGDEVAPGAVGEIVIAGAGVTLGYWNDPVETHRRFVPDVDVPGALAYRTGDLAVRGADGVLRFVGRNDNMAKLRGQRISPEEIESHLLRIPGVRRAVAIVERGGRHLAAGIETPLGFDAIDVAAALRDLRETTPAHLVPSRIVTFGRLPLNSNGKVDRGKARDLIEDRRCGTELGLDDGAAPTAATLASLWSAVLGTVVAPEDNVFDLGADSLHVVEIVGLLAEAGWSVSYEEVYRSPRPASLVEHLTGHEVDAPEASSDETHRTTATPAVAWYLDGDLHGQGMWGQSATYVLGPDESIATANHRLASFVARHDAFGLRLDPTHGGVALRDPADGGTRIRFLELGRCAGHTSTHCPEAAAAAAQLVDVVDGPLVAAASCHGDGASRLTIVAHHLAVDAVSWRLLLAELRHPRGGTDSGVLGSWATTVATRAEGEWRELVPYWASVLAAGPPVFDRPPTTRQGTVARSQVLLEVDATAAIADAGRVREGTFRRLLHATASCLVPWTTGHRIRLDVEMHGRDPSVVGVDARRAMGWFAACFPVAIPVGDAGVVPPSAAAAALKDVPHGGQSFSALRYLGRAEDRAALAAAPRSTVCLNYLGRHASTGRPIISQRDDAAPPPYEVEVDAWIEAGRLAVEVTSSCGVALATDLARAIEETLGHR